MAHWNLCPLKSKSKSKSRASLAMSDASSCYLPLVAMCIAFGLLIMQCQPTASVVVDGKRKGPSALKNQSHEEDMIDGYNTKTCGISDPDTKETGFVNSARDGQFPWLVSFQVKRKDGKHNHFCMGAFISDRWILSAAHCFADPHIKPYLESHKILITGGSAEVHHPKNEQFTIKRIFYHSKFDLSSPIGFDVALIEVSEKAQVRTKYENKLPFINTVCLPIEGKSFKKGQVVKIAGWGDSESKDPQSKPERLLTTDLILTDAERCASIYAQRLKKVKGQYDNYKDFICADYNGERDACQGDSGSPLLEYADGKAVAVGIVSYGMGCATKGVPGVYSKTSSFMPWIKDITQNKEKASVQYTLLKTVADN